MSTQDTDWGITSHTKTLWREQDGTPVYIARFMRMHRKNGKLTGYETCAIQLRTHRPIVAMRYILAQANQRSQHPRTFSGDRFDFARQGREYTRVEPTQPPA